MIPNIIEAIKRILSGANPTFNTIVYAAISDPTDSKNINIPLIGLAKREETIITSDLEEIALPKDSKALLMIIKIAHSQISGLINKKLLNGRNRIRNC